jgi:hypothetical protein
VVNRKVHIAVANYGKHEGEQQASENKGHLHAGSLENHKQPNLYQEIYHTTKLAEAYEQVSRTKGANTPSVDGETLDGVS